jgi:hypothetical protein
MLHIYARPPARFPEKKERAGANVLSLKFAEKPE